MDWLALIEYFLLFGLFLVALGGDDYRTPRKLADYVYSHNICRGY